MRYMVPVLVGLLAVSCVRSSYYELDTWAKAYEPPAAQMAASDDDIRDSVFRFQMVNSASKQGKKVHAYYLSVEGGQDPSDEFIRRYANSQTPVKKQSTCSVTSQDPLGVVDKETGLPGIILSIESLTRSGDVEADVTGGFYEGGQSASTNTYHLEFKNAHWAVKDSTPKKEP